MKTLKSNHDAVSLLKELHKDRAELLLNKIRSQHTPDSSCTSYHCNGHSQTSTHK